MLREQEGERAAEGAGGSGNGLVTDGDGLTKCVLGFIESVVLKESVAEIAKIDALIVLLADFSGDGEGLRGVRDGLFVMTLRLATSAEICELDALTALVADFSSDGDGLARRVAPLPMSASAAWAAGPGQDSYAPYETDGLVQAKLRSSDRRPARASSTPSSSSSSSREQKQQLRVCGHAVSQCQMVCGILVLVSVITGGLVAAVVSYLGAVQDV